MEPVEEVITVVDASPENYVYNVPDAFEQDPNIVRAELLFFNNPQLQPFSGPAYYALKNVQDQCQIDIQKFCSEPTVSFVDAKDVMEIFFSSSFPFLLNRRLHETGESFTPVQYSGRKLIQFMRSFYVPTKETDFKDNETPILSAKATPAVAPANIFLNKKTDKQEHHSLAMDPHSHLMRGSQNPKLSHMTKKLRPENPRRKLRLFRDSAAQSRDANSLLTMPLTDPMPNGGFSAGFKGNGKNFVKEDEGPASYPLNMLLPMVNEGPREEDPHHPRPPPPHDDPHHPARDPRNDPHHPPRPPSPPDAPPRDDPHHPPPRPPHPGPNRDDDGDSDVDSDDEDDDFVPHHHDSHHHGYHHEERPMLEDSYFPGALGFGASGDYCLYENAENLSPPCAQAIVDVYALREQYWSSYTETQQPHHHHHPVMGLVFVGLILVVLVKKIMHAPRRRQMQKFLSALNDQPELKAQLESQLNMEIPKPRSATCCGGERNSFCRRLFFALGYVFFAFFASIFIAVTSLEMTAGIIDGMENREPEDAPPVSLFTVVVILTAIVVGQLMLLRMLLQAVGRLWRRNCGATIDDNNAVVDDNVSASSSSTPPPSGNGGPGLHVELQRLASLPVSFYREYVSPRMTSFFAARAATSEGYAPLRTGESEEREMIAVGRHVASPVHVQQQPVQYTVYTGVPVNPNNIVQLAARPVSAVNLV